MKKSKSILSCTVIIFRNDKITQLYLSTTISHFTIFVFYFFRFRQYGLWDRYTEIYPNIDLIYTVGSSNYQTDWFFAHVNKYIYKYVHKHPFPFSLFK